MALLAESQGAGEIIIQSIDRDGLMAGYDIALIKMISEKVSIPVVALGGAGDFNHIKSAIKQLIRMQWLEEVFLFITAQRKAF